MNQAASGFVPEIVVLFCRQSVAGEIDPITAPKAASDLKLRFASLTCSSKLELPHLFRVLEGGADGVMLVACPVDGCARMTGSAMSGRRVERGKKLLESAGVGSGRLLLERGTGLTLEELVRRARAFAETLRPLGPSPMKGVLKK